VLEFGFQQFDALGLLQQIGAVPALGQPPA
jgi:hypothetical protein